MKTWRVGRRVPRHVYLQRGPMEDDGDEPLCTFPTAEQAKLAAQAPRMARLLHVVLFGNATPDWGVEAQECLRDAGVLE